MEGIFWLRALQMLVSTRAPGSIEFLFRRDRFNLAIIERELLGGTRSE
jgi:hypothetical protein